MRSVSAASVRSTDMAANLGITDDQIIEALREHKTQRKAAAALGMSKRNMERRAPKLVDRARSTAPGRTVHHYVVPDCQIRPGDVTDFLDWIALDIVKRKPDVIVCIGDFWDLPSLSGHSPAGGVEKEGARLLADLKAGEDAMARLMGPVLGEVERLRTKRGKAWKPRLIFTEGNHEHRAARFASDDARFEGVVGTHLCNVEHFGFERYKFEQPVTVDGVWYCHYWKTAHSPRPIGGTIDNRLNKLGFSFVQGHEQGKRYGDRPLANGKTIHGLVLGSCYLGVEKYRGPQGANEWRGTAVLHDVRDGDFEPMFLTLRWLCQRYTGEPLTEYLRKRYPERDWSHLT